MNYWYVTVISTVFWLLVLAFMILYFDRYYWEKYVNDCNYKSYLEGYLSYLPEDEYRKICELDLLDKESDSLKCYSDYVMYSSTDKEIVLAIFRYSVGLVCKSYIYSMWYHNVSYAKYPIKVKIDELGKGKLSTIFDKLKNAKVKL